MNFLSEVMINHEYFLSGGYLGLLMGYSLLNITKIINPVLSIITSCISYITPGQKTEKMKIKEMN